MMTAFGWLDFLDSVLNAPHLFFHKIALPVTLVGIAVAHYSLSLAICTRG